MKYGELFKLCRKELKLNQEKMAALLGVSQATVSKIEQNSSEPTVVMLRTLAITARAKGCEGCTGWIAAYLWGR